MRTNDIIGFQAFHHDTGTFLHFDPVTGTNFLQAGAPEPISRGDCHRRIAAWLEQPGNESNDDFSIDAVYRQTTPVEDAAAELGGLLESLCSRHGVRVGLTREQINAQLQKELSALESGDVSFLYAGLPHR